MSTEDDEEKAENNEMNFGELLTELQNKLYICMEINKERVLHTAAGNAKFV